MHQEKHDDPESYHGKDDAPPRKRTLDDIQASHDGDEAGRESEEIPARWTFVMTMTL